MCGLGYSLAEPGFDCRQGL